MCLTETSTPVQASDNMVSLLDTPVPETPDIPLSPSQLFGFNQLGQAPLKPCDSESSTTGSPQSADLPITRQSNSLTSPPPIPSSLSTTATAKSLDQLNDLTQQIQDKKGMYEDIYIITIDFFLSNIIIVSIWHLRRC